jgi:hypothetical protein
VRGRGDSKTGGDGFRDHSLYVFAPVPTALAMRFFQPWFIHQRSLERGPVMALVPEAVRQPTAQAVVRACWGSVRRAFNPGGIANECGFYWCWDLSNRSMPRLSQTAPSRPSSAMANALTRSNRSRRVGSQMRVEDSPCRTAGPLCHGTMLPLLMRRSTCFTACLVTSPRACAKA